MGNNNENFQDNPPNTGNEQNNPEQPNNSLPNGMLQQQTQPQPQMTHPLKQPMSPTKKKKVILGISLGIGAIIVATIAIAMFSILTKADYGESYRVAGELKPKVTDINNNYDCSRVIEYANSEHIATEAYDEYVTKCTAIADGVDELVVRLGQTSGVKQDQDIKAQYDRFREAIESILPDEDELKERLELYKIWHRFIATVDNLDAGKSSDAEIQNAAKILTESGNEILSEYGAGWLEKTTAYIQAYRAYYNTDYPDSKTWTNLWTAMNDVQTERKNWIVTNKPDITEIGGLSFENASKMYSEFTKLYDLIIEKYEENYDGSGDCTEFLGEVFCS